MKRHILALAVALACTATGSARLHAQEPQTAAAHGADLLTHDQLAASGHDNLSEALRRLRPRWMRLNSLRGRFATVYVDSIHRGSTDVLASLNVADVRWVQYSGPDVVEERFGKIGRTPVIHVSTRLPLSAAHPDLPAAPAFESRPLVSLFATAVNASGSRLGDVSALGPGVGAGVELPVMRNVAVTGSASYLPGDRGSGTTEGSLGLWSGEVGVKARLNSDRVLSSFVSAGAGVYSLRWGTVRANGEIRDEAYSELGFGLSLGAGVEMRVSRALIFARGDAAVPSFEWRREEKLFTLRIGSSFRLSR